MVGSREGGEGMAGTAVKAILPQSLRLERKSRADRPFTEEGCKRMRILNRVHFDPIQFLALQTQSSDANPTGEESGRVTERLNIPRRDGGRLFCNCWWRIGYRGEILKPRRFAAFIVNWRGR